MLEPKQQFKELLQKSKNILILTAENPDGDQLGSVLALNRFLSQKDLQTFPILPRGKTEKFSFLPWPEKFSQEISSAREFILSFDTTQNGIRNVRYEEKEGRFEIFITPEKGVINPKDFSFIPAKYKFDLVIVLGISDLEKLGELYEKNADLFFEVPIVNIDCHSENESFGQINLIHLNASSVSEILYYFFEETDPTFIDKEIAQCLLTGIISATDSFQKKNTTPKAFLTAALLIDKGADQQKIVQHLYKTQALNILKLWGRVMSKLNWEESSKLVWSELSVDDFVQSRSNPKDLPSILEKMQSNFSEGKIFAAIYNDTTSSCVVVLRPASEEILKKISSLFIGGQYQNGVLEIRFETNDLFEVGRILKEKIAEQK